MNYGTNASLIFYIKMKKKEQTQVCLPGNNTKNQSAWIDVEHHLAENGARNACKTLYSLQPGLVLVEVGFVEVLNDACSGRKIAGMERVGHLNKLDGHGAVVQLSRCENVFKTGQSSIYNFELALKSWFQLSSVCGSR